MRGSSDNVVPLRLNFDRLKSGDPRACLSNVIEVLEKDPPYRGRLGWCTFSVQPLLDGAPMEPSFSGELADDIGRRHRFHPSQAIIEWALHTVSRRQTSNPVLEYLAPLEWDGRRRVDDWLAVYMGCPDDRLSAVYGRKFLISCVARALDPGCKVDTMLVFLGEQGAGKSRGIRALATGSGSRAGRGVSASWFSDTKIPVGDKDAYLQLQGVWLYEVAELAGLRRSDAETIKNFISSGVDAFRAPYDRQVRRWPRRTVFMGSTNRAQFLNDQTGSRRFWVRETGHVDVEGIEREREQLWAEAFEAYGTGERWWLDDDEDLARAEQAGRYTQEDPWRGAIASWLAKDAGSTAGRTVQEILAGAVDKPVARQQKRDEMRVGDILQELGWKKRRRRTGQGQRPMLWFPA